MGTLAFTKTYLNPAQHIALLKSRGIQITDENLAAAYLTNVGYYRLSAYFYPLLEIPKENHIYKPTATFDKVVSMYTKEYNGSKEDFIEHFKATYNEPYPPAWMILEILPFGNMAHIYMNLTDFSLKKKIAQHFGLQPPVFTSWLLVLSGLRNLCCHHSRVWNKLLPIRPAEPRRVIYPWIDPAKTNSQRIYFRCAMISYMLCTIEAGNNLKAELKALFAEYPNIDLQAMGFPSDWEKEPIWR